MKNRQHGISMVEVLVALVISLFLLAGVVQVYTGNRAAYTFTDAVSRMQENGRFALDTMTQDLRMAGFYGCAMFDPEDTSNIANNLDPAGEDYDPNIFDFSVPIDGSENDGQNGSDSITIRGAKPGQYNVKPPYNVSTSATIFITANTTVEPEDIVMISNCRGADIFQVTNATQAGGAAKMSVVHNTGTGKPGNYNPDSCQGGNAHCLSQTYGSDASLFRLQTVIYTIAPGESGEPALWRSENNTNIELIDGVEQMQVLYGIDTDDDKFPNQYVISTAVPEMYDVMSIRLMLLIRSSNDFIAESPQTYTFNGATVTPNDRRLRQVYTTTIALRNRIGA